MRIARTTDTVYHMQCAGSVAAPKKGMTQAQKNRAKLEAYNAGRTVAMQSTTISNQLRDQDKGGEERRTKSMVVTPTLKSEPKEDSDSDKGQPKPRRKHSGRSKSMIDRAAASLQTMYLAEMTPTQADDVILLQCAGSVVGPKKALTNAQKNKMAIDAYNAKVAARTTAKAK